MQNLTPLFELLPPEAKRSSPPRTCSGSPGGAAAKPDPDSNRQWHRARSASSTKVAEAATAVEAPYLDGCVDAVA
jgi:hypothetical protein